MANQYHSFYLSELEQLINEQAILTIGTEHSQTLVDNPYEAYVGGVLRMGKNLHDKLQKEAEEGENDD